MGTIHVDGKIGILRIAGSQAFLAPDDFVSKVYAESRDTIYRYLASLGTEPSVAQDLTQEVFLKLYVAIRQGKQIDNVQAWTFTVASHLALNHLRAASHRDSISPQDVDNWMDSRAQRGPDPEKAILQREKAVALQQAISGLSAQQQVCLHLRAEGFRYREIARIVGVTVPTVAEFLRRAISKLRKRGL